MSILKREAWADVSKWCRFLGVNEKLTFMKLEIIFFSVEIGEKNRTPDREMRSNVRLFSREKPSGKSRLFGCGLL